MKKLFTFFTAILFAGILFAQSPQKMSYQAVVRDASNKLVVNHQVGMQVSILQGSISGTAVYTETQTPTTNANGLVSFEIGGQSGFDVIDWSAGPYYIKTETDPTGGTSYTITGVSQLLSVPYALYAEKSGSPGPQGEKGDKGDQGIQGEQGLQGIKGDTGAQGLKGDRGDTGDQGRIGPKGIDGVNGLTTSVNGVTQIDGAITLTKSDLDLGNVDNTSDANKPVSSDTQTALNQKVDKVTGKGLSSEDYSTAEKAKLNGIAENANVGVLPNAGITGATKTKITYDTKGLVTTGTDATTADIDASTDKNYVTDAQKIVISNTSGTNTGDNAVNSNYSGLVSNATHDGDAEGATTLTVKKINGVALSSLATGILKNTTGTGVPSIAVAGTDYSLVREFSNEYSATAGQTSFTLSNTPSASCQIKMYINGIRIAKAACMLSGTTATYVPGSNGSYALVAGDRIQIDYYY